MFELYFSNLSWLSAKSVLCLLGCTCGSNTHLDSNGKWVIHSRLNISFLKLSPNNAYSWAWLEISLLPLSRIILLVAIVNHIICFPLVRLFLSPMHEQKFCNSEFKFWKLFSKMCPCKLLKTAADSNDRG